MTTPSTITTRTAVAAQLWLHTRTAELRRRMADAARRDDGLVTAEILMFLIVALGFIVAVAALRTNVAATLETRINGLVSSIT